MRLVQNTTDIPSATIERILHDLGGDVLSCAVRVKNSRKTPWFLGTFYAELQGTVVERNGKVYELGGRRYGCKHVITLRVPAVCMPMPARTSGGKRFYIEVPDRTIGLVLLAAHELEHARLYEAGLNHRDERACDDWKIEIARQLGLKISVNWDDVEKQDDGGPRTIRSNERLWGPSIPSVS